MTRYSHLSVLLIGNGHKKYERGILSAKKFLSLISMKIRVCILIAVWSLLLLEPLSANFNIHSAYSSCREEKETVSCCTKSQCKKPGTKREDTNCENNRCNPLMSCPTGNFYFSNLPDLSLALPILIKKKKVLHNDNRLAQYMAECWNPPEII